jgi:tetratricopeptide (TPR) repeat protein
LLLIYEAGGNIKSRHSKEECARACCSIALKYYEKKDYGNALLFLNNALDKDPSCTIALYNRALCHFRLHGEKKEPEGAGEGVPRRITYVGGEAEEEVPQELKSAMRHVEEAICINPHLAEAYFLRGSIYEELGLNVFARKDFEEVARLRPPLQSGSPPEGMKDITGPFPLQVREGEGAGAGSTRSSGKAVSGGAKISFKIARALVLAFALSLTVDKCQSGFPNPGAHPKRQSNLDESPENSPARPTKHDYPVLGKSFPRKRFPLPGRNREMRKRLPPVKLRRAC